MKNILYCLVILFTIGLSVRLNAQSTYVTLPDTNFRNYLQGAYPNCFNVQGQMDTTCSDITTATTLFVNNNFPSDTISNMDGIRYFKSLQTLYCNDIGLSYLPDLPATLTYLNIQGNLFTLLPALPSSLTTLYCSANPFADINGLPPKLKHLECSDAKLTSLPPNLPRSLTLINVASNNLTSLPALPPLLDTLYCQINQLTYLPALPGPLLLLNCIDNNLSGLPQLPPSLQELDVSQNQLTSLPALPDSLTLLQCSFNQLTELPTLPNTLGQLLCSYNKIGSLPALPPYLTWLYCDQNKITVLPPLPPYLQELYAGDNQLTFLPDTLPQGLSVLEIINNQISNIPPLPAGLYNLSCDSNPVSCLPALPSGLVVLLAKYTNITCLPPVPASVTNTDVSLPTCTTDCFTNPYPYINIPDSNFRKYLVQNFPSCMNGNQQLDTSCTGIINTTSLDVSILNISDLTGIQYFKNLNILNCSQNNLQGLPSLPATLTYLDCSSNKMNGLPALPPGLITLNCGGGSLATLPQLPNSIKHLNCFVNSITKLPALPDSLIFLDCSYNQLDSLPALPKKLDTLYCYNNYLDSLPALPASLTVLSCTDNQMQCLPALPNGLVFLGASDNGITCLPNLPSSLTTTDIGTSVCSTPCKYVNHYVYIPDPNLRNHLMYQNQYRACFNDHGQMDTTCSGILNETELIVSGLYITDLTGVQYFKNLTSLDCSNNIILDSLPSRLPASLTTLWCSQNNINALPALPSSLVNLDCSMNIITEMPTIPSTLCTLNCWQNNLTTLPALPSTLTTLNCFQNKLTSLPALPSSLARLVCEENQLTNLPALPASLKQFYCDYNQISSLPALPDSLTELGCSFNKLSNLPTLPALLTQLNCSYNNIHCLPPLTTNLTTLQATFNHISCLPNLPSALVSGMDSTWMVCNDTNNINNCSIVIDTIKGQLTDPGHSNAEVYLLKLNADSTLSVIDSSIVAADGTFELESAYSPVYIYYVPDTVLYPFHMPTYFDNSPSGAALFNDAQAINLNSNITVSLSSIIGADSGGTGVINGTVTLSVSNGRVASNAAANLKLVLMDSLGNPVQTAVTNSSGMFYFSGLKPEKYTIMADVPAFSNFNPPVINLDTTNNQSNLQFALTSTSLELVQAVTAVNQPVSSSNTISLYPNPATEILYISTNSNQGSLSYSLTDMAGVMVRTGTGNTINVSALQKGVYLIKIQTDNTVTYNKVVIE